MSGAVEGFLTSAPESLRAPKGRPPVVACALPGVAVAEVGGKIYVVGGFRGERELEIYDPAADRWNRSRRKLFLSPQGL
jgi:Kelch motif